MPDHVLDDTIFDTQRTFEREARARGVARYRRLAQQAVERGDGAALKPAERLMVHWFAAFRNLIAAEKRQIAQGIAARGRKVYGPYLRRCNTAKVAVIVMHQAVSGCMAEIPGVKAVDLVLAIGRTINADCNLRWLRRHKGGETAEPWTELTRTDRRGFKPKIVNRIANRFEPGARWPLSVQAHLGAALLELLIRSASIADYDKPFEAAFEKKKRFAKGKTIGMIRLTFDAMDLIEQGHKYRQKLAPRYLPMVVPPLEWTDQSPGGYLGLPVTIIKRPGRSSDDIRRSATAREALNAINATPWRVNKRILSVVEELADSGGNIAGIPRLFDLPKPTLPPDFETDPESKKRWKSRAVHTRRLNLQARAEAVCFGYKLDIAQQFAGFRRLYFPHQYDFRIRNYPVPLHLHHQGDDVCRGLLEYAVAKTPDTEGLRWLKIHLASCCGVDKCRLDERVAWVDANRDTIDGWCAEPLENTGWMEVDKPFQALAAAFTLNDEQAASHLPVQLDGSNNALQHYAAMLRCEQTAGLVNLVPADSPADGYAAVAGRVAALVGRDADKGHKIARRLEGWIDRNIVKQTVMTTSYGVTNHGAMDQLYGHLKSAGFADDDNLFAVCSYLAGHCLAGTRQTFTAAGRAMAWLEDTARKITKTTGEPVRWTSPLGIEIEQPYRNSTTHDVRTILQRLKVNRRDQQCPVSVGRQVRGFAPNFVHSLDASHLMCTAIVCRDAGIHFAGVHDAGWSHAVDADRLGRIEREQFIQIHERPALETLAEDFRNRYPSCKLPDPPDCGHFDMSQVLEATYAFT